MSPNARPPPLPSPRLGALLVRWRRSRSPAAAIDYASNDPVAAGDYHERHPIVLAEAPTTLDVFPVGGSGLDAESVADIREFAARYRALGAGRITILTPGRRVRARRARRSTRSAARSPPTGLRGYVGVGSYPVADPLARRAGAADLPGAEGDGADRCGQWPSDLASGASIDGWKNEDYENFGCATQSMLAAQVDDPRDFVQARAIGAAGRRRCGCGRSATCATARIRAPTGRSQLTPIGQVGGRLIDARASRRRRRRRSRKRRRRSPQIDPVPRVSIQAFCETPEIAAIVQAAIADRRMSKAHVKQNMGGAAAAVEAYRNAPTPNVIVLEATANRDALVEPARRALAIIATPARRSSCSARSTTSCSIAS